MNLVCAGRAFVLSGPEFTPAPHLWFILTDPEPPDDQVVAVMLVTSRAHTDKTVTLVPGDHPFVQHESNVDFGSAILVRSGRFQRAMQGGRCHFQPDMNASLLRRLRGGLLASPRTVHWIADHCRARF